MLEMQPRVRVWVRFWFRFWVRVEMAVRDVALVRTFSSRRVPWR